MPLHLSWAFNLQQPQSNVRKPAILETRFAYTNNCQTSSIRTSNSNTPNNTNTAMPYHGSSHSYVSSRTAVVDVAPGTRYSGTRGRSSTHTETARRVAEGGHSQSRHPSSHVGASSHHSHSRTHHSTPSSRTAAPSTRTHHSSSSSRTVTPGTRTHHSSASSSRTAHGSSRQADVLPTHMSNDSRLGTDWRSTRVGGLSTIREEEGGKSSSRTATPSNMQLVPYAGGKAPISSRASRSHATVPRSSSTTSRTSHTRGAVAAVQTRPSEIWHDANGDSVRVIPVSLVQQSSTHSSTHQGSGCCVHGSHCGHGCGGGDGRMELYHRNRHGSVARLRLD